MPIYSSCSGPFNSISHNSEFLNIPREDKLILPSLGAQRGHTWDISSWTSDLQHGIRLPLFQNRREASQAGAYSIQFLQKTQVLWGESLQLSHAWLISKWLKIMNTKCMRGMEMSLVWINFYFTIYLQTTMYNRLDSWICFMAPLHP